jgi:hypothetical protein
MRSTVLSVLGRILGAIRSLTGIFGSEHDWIERVRSSVLRLVHPVASRLGRPTVRAKGPSDYVCTVPTAVESLERVFEPVYQRNLLATKKYRERDESTQWAAGSWVHTETYDGDAQHHVYLFSAPGGGTDIYGHREANVTEPARHQHGPQVHGDPDGVLRDTLDEAGVDRYTRTL